MRRSFLRILVWMVPVLVCGCGGGNRTANVSLEGKAIYTPRHATGFVVEEVEQGKLLRIYDPWQGAEGITREILLVGDKSMAPKSFGGITLEVPLKNVVCMSSTYVAFIDALGKTEAITGVSGAKYISNPAVRQRYGTGQVRDVGYDTNINYELLAAVSPDVVFAYGITGENSVLTSKLARLGIDVVYIGDYVEQSPLGKAEWLVAFGYLFGEEEQAVREFSAIEERYDSLKSFAQEIWGCERSEDWSMDDPYGFVVPDGWAEGVHFDEEDFEMLYTPVVMLNSPYRDTWFVPGDKSYMVQLIADACGRYACAGEDSDASRPISLETAYVKMLSADVWLNPGQATTLAGVRADNPRFSETPPVMNGRVYNCNKRQTPEGGSDFWESGAVRPDVVLEDMIRIFYPWRFEEGELYYFQQLE